MPNTLFLQAPLSLAHLFLAAAGILCLALSCAYGVVAALAVARRRLEPSHEPVPADPALAVVTRLIAELPRLPFAVVINALREFIRHETARMRTMRMLRPWSFPFLFISSSLPLAFMGFVLSFTQPSFHQVSPALLIVSIYARFVLHRLSRAAGDPAGRAELCFLPLRDLLVFWVWCRVLFTPRAVRMSRVLAESR